MRQTQLTSQRTQSDGASLNRKNSMVNRSKGMNLAQFAWAAMFCSFLIWGIGEVAQGTLGNYKNWYRILLVLIAAGASTLVLLRQSSRIQNAMSLPLLLFLAYGTVALISSLYVPMNSFYSMWKAFEVIVDVLLIAAILSYRNQHDFSLTPYRIIVTLFFVLIATYCVEAALFPSKAFIPSRGYIPVIMQGVLPVMQQNALAFLSSVVTFFAICRTLSTPHGKTRLLAILVALVAFGTLVLAQSRTSFVGLFVAVTIYLLFDRRIALLIFVAFLAIMVLLTSTVSDVAYRYLLRGQDEHLLMSLSGRTHGWEVAWAMFKESPILGHGFAAAARTDILGISGASTLHGSIFDVLVGVGLLGLIPWTAAILITAARLLRLSFSRHPWFRTRQGRVAQAEMVGLLSLLVVRSLTSSGLAMHDYTFMLFLSIVAYVTATNHRLRQSQPAPAMANRVVTAGHAIPRDGGSRLLQSRGIHNRS
jgi:O-antigen ligase